MWFDPVALSKTFPPATLATSATFYADFSDERSADSEKSQESQESQKSQAPHDLEVAIAAPWDANDWQAFFDERAGVAEFDGALPRPQAESMAYRSCVSEWLTQHHVASEPDICEWCGRGEISGRAILPYGYADHGHTWLHSECWSAWYARRRQTAITALKALGLHEGRQTQ